MDESASSEEADDTEKSTASVSADDEDSASADDKIENEKSDDKEEMEEGGDSSVGDEVDRKMKMDEEAKVSKKKGRTPKKADTKKSTTPANGHGTGRERKQVERFTVPTKSPSKKGYEQPLDAPGKGLKFGDIPFITEKINVSGAF